MNTITAAPGKSALALLLIAVVGAVLLAGIYQLTRERIIIQQQQAVLNSLNQIIPAEHYDNALETDFVLLREPEFFRHSDPIKVWRARKGDAAVAVIMQLVAPDGYNGDIQLLVGIDNSGRLLGVRVTQHRETPGLGDAIETQRSPWILSFNGYSLAATQRADWDVKRYGGVFDQFTGATITPRAVVRAVARALEYFDANGEDLFAAPSDFDMDAP